MELLTRIEAEIRIKYKDIASIIRHEDFIVLTFLTAENGIKDIYKGIVERVDDIGNLSIDWENGRTLSLVIGVDEFKVLEN